MPSFSLTPLDPFPPVSGQFLAGTQFQDELTNVGPPGPKYVNFTGDGVQATYDSNAGRVNVTISSGGGGGGLWGTPLFFAKRAGSNKYGEGILVYNQATVFDSNAGQYDTDTGIFTAAQEGIFSFSASAVLRLGGEGRQTSDYYLVIAQIQNEALLPFSGYKAISFGSMPEVGSPLPGLIAGSASVSAFYMLPGDKVGVFVIYELSTDAWGEVLTLMPFTFLQEVDNVSGTRGGSLSHFSAVYYPYFGH